MPDPVMIAIASAVAGKTTEALTAGAKNALGKLVELIRRRFARDDAAPKALEGADADTLAAHLERLAAQDPEFARELRALWSQASTQLHAEHGGVINEVSGDVGGNVVQARDVTGGISFNTPSRRDSSG
jgi:hypothetical protein